MVVEAIGFGEWQNVLLENPAVDETCKALAWDWRMKDEYSEGEAVGWFRLTEVLTSQMCHFAQSSAILRIFVNTE